MVALFRVNSSFTIYFDLSIPFISSRLTVSVASTRCSFVRPPVTMVTIPDFTGDATLRLLPSVKAIIAIAEIAISFRIFVIGHELERQH